MRQECLDHLLILHEKQLQRVLNLYVAYLIGHVHIKVESSRYLNRVDPLVPLTMWGQGDGSSDLG